MYINVNKDAYLLSPLFFAAFIFHSFSLITKKSNNLVPLRGLPSRIDYNLKTGNGLSFWIKV